MKFLLVESPGKYEEEELRQCIGYLKNQIYISCAVQRKVDCTMGAKCAYMHTETISGCMMGMCQEGKNCEVKLYFSSSEIFLKSLSRCIIKLNSLLTPKWLVGTKQGGALTKLLI